MWWRACGIVAVVMVMISRKHAQTVPSGKRPPEHHKPENGRLSTRAHFKKSTCHDEPHAEFWWHMRNFGGIFCAEKRDRGPRLGRLVGNGAPAPWYARRHSHRHSARALKIKLNKRITTPRTASRLHRTTALAPPPPRVSPASSPCASPPSIVDCRPSIADR